MFKEAVELIGKFPQIGRPTEIENVRIKLVRDYLIVYEETHAHIGVLRVWDARRDPDNLKKFLQ